MRIRKEGNKICLDQIPYLEKIIQRFGLTNCRRVYTPLPDGYRPTQTLVDLKIDPKLQQHFQSVIGSLLYIMLGTCPDVAFAVTKLAQFAANPMQEHLDKPLYIAKYLWTTKDYQLVYNGDSGSGLIAFLDSDYTGDPINRRSITGNMFMLANGIFS
jgi:hypothetical protein